MIIIITIGLPRFQNVVFVENSVYNKHHDNYCYCCLNLYLGILYSNNSDLMFSRKFIFGFLGILLRKVMTKLLHTINIALFSTTKLQYASIRSCCQWIIELNK